MNWAQILGFEQWAPDADPTRQGTITDLLNFIPSERGWRSAYSLADAGVSSMSSTCCGAFLMQKLDGTNLVFAGTASTLLLNVGYTWTVICSDSYHASESQRWRWATMGDYVLAATQSDTIAVSNAGATFTSITGAPKARMIESVYGFIMAAGTIDATYGEQPDRWYCSAIFDHTSWTPSAITQCTTGRLVDTPGPITGLRRLGSSVVAYKDSSLYLGQYVEPPTVWSWTLVSSNIGCPSHDAIVNIGKAHVFMGRDNFYIYDGAQISAIGEPIRRWFFDSQLLRTSEARIQSCHDAGHALVYWFYPSTAGTGALDRALVYSYKLGRWGLCEYPVEAAMEFAQTITYDGLGDYYTTYDDGIERVYDTPTWIPGTVFAGIISTGHRTKTIDGVSSSGYFTTWHMGDDQRYTLFRRFRVRWLDDPTEAKAELYTRAEHGGSFTLRSTSWQSNNKFDMLASSRWHRVKVLTTGDCEVAGVTADVVPQGDW